MALPVLISLAFSLQLVAAGVSHDPFGQPVLLHAPSPRLSVQPSPGQTVHVPSGVHTVQPAGQPFRPVPQAPVPQFPGPVQQVPGLVHPVQQVPGPVHPVQQVPGQVHSVQQIPGQVHQVQQVPVIGLPAPSFIPSVHLTPVPAPKPLITVDDACLKCICLASSGCAPRACHLAGPSQYFCGSYLISWAYWADAGKPQDNPHDPHTFEKCLTHNQCAEQTVRAYMAKYGKDCNFDGQINCLDFAKIHKSGPHGCTSAQWVDNTEYWKILTSCVANQTRIN
ncbi:hypothetical protein CHUAL_007757 [Chamberlinius hualienensis]